MPTNMRLTLRLQTEYGELRFTYEGRDEFPSQPVNHNQCDGQFPATQGNYLRFVVWDEVQYLFSGGELEQPSLGVWCTLLHTPDDFLMQTLRVALRNTPWSTLVGQNHMPLPSCHPSRSTSNLSSITSLKARINVVATDEMLGREWFFCSVPPSYPGGGSRGGSGFDV